MNETLGHGLPANDQSLLNYLHNRKSLKGGGSGMDRVYV